MATNRIHSRTLGTTKEAEVNHENDQSSPSDEDMKPLLDNGKMSLKLLVKKRQYLQRTIWMTWLSTNSLKWPVLYSIIPNIYGKVLTKAEGYLKNIITCAVAEAVSDAVKPLIDMIQSQGEQIGCLQQDNSTLWQDNGNLRRHYSSKWAVWKTNITLIPLCPNEKHRHTKYG